MSSRVEIIWDGRRRVMLQDTLPVASFSSNSIYGPAEFLVTNDLVLIEGNVEMVKLFHIKDGFPLVGNSISYSMKVIIHCPMLSLSV